MANKLHKSQTNRMIAGVCGGLGEYFSVDPTLVRLLFVLFAFLNGFGILAYIVLAIVTPEPTSVEQAPGEVVRENLGRLREEAERLAGEIRGQPSATATVEPPTQADTGRAGNRQLIGGAILVLLGAILLLDNLNLFWWFRMDRLWPVALIAVGAFLLWDQMRRRR